MLVEMPTDKYSNNTGTRRKHSAVGVGVGGGKRSFQRKPTRKQLRSSFHTHNNSANNGKHPRQAQRMRCAVPWCVHSVLFCAYSVETYNWFSTFHLCMAKYVTMMYNTKSHYNIVDSACRCIPNKTCTERTHAPRPGDTCTALPTFATQHRATTKRAKITGKTFPEMLAKRWKNECKYIYSRKIICI